MSAGTLPRRTCLGCLVGIVLLVWFSPAPARAGAEITPLERARESYEAGEYGKVITELEAALVRSSAYTPEEIASMHLYLGLAYLSFGRSDRAHREFVAGIRLDLGLEVDPAHRSPEVQEAFQRARWVVEEERARAAREGALPEAPLGQAIEISEIPTGKTRWGGLWRSCLLPGWGQYYGGRMTRGHAFLGSEVVSLGGAVFATIKRDRAHDDYQVAKEAVGSSVQDADRLYDDYDSWRNTRRTLLVVAGGIWVLNVLESVLNDPATPNEERAMEAWRVGGVAVEPGGWRVALTRAF